MEVNENIVTVDTLKQQGFSDEELQGLIPQAEQAEEVKEEVAEQVEEPAQTEEVKEQPAPDSEKVSKHVPYDRFREVNEKAKALAAELAAIKAKQAQEPQPVHQPIAQPQVDSSAKAKYFAAISSNADKEAREIHGIESVDLTELQFTDNAKYQAYLDTRATLVQEKHINNMRINAVRQQNEMYVQRLRQDPLFIPVYQFATELLQDLPAREVMKFKEAESRIMQFSGNDADFALIDKYMDEYKVKYLAATGQAVGQQPQHQVQQQTKAPLEKAEGLPRANNLSGAKSAAMSWAQVEQLIRDGKADQIPKEMLAQIDPRLIE